GGGGQSSQAVQPDAGNRDAGGQARRVGEGGSGARQDLQPRFGELSQAGAVPSPVSGVRAVADGSLHPAAEPGGRAEGKTRAGGGGVERGEEVRGDGLLNQVDYERAKDTVRVAEVELEQAEGSGRLGHEARDFEIQDRRRQIDRQRLVVEDLERRVGELTLRA